MDDAVLIFPFGFLGKTSIGAGSARAMSFLYWDFNLKMGRSSSSSRKTKTSSWIPGSLKGSQPLLWLQKRVSLFDYGKERISNPASSNSLTNSFISQHTSNKTVRPPTASPLRGQTQTRKSSHSCQDWILFLIENRASTIRALVVASSPIITLMHWS